MNCEFLKNFNNEERAKIIDLFIEDSSAIILKIKKYFEAENSAMLNSNIHSLKGISANIGAKKLSDYIKAIDKNINSESIRVIDFLYEDLVKELEKCKTEDSQRN